MSAVPPGNCPVTTDLNRLHLTGTLESEPLLTSVGDHPLATLTLVGERWWRTPAGTRKRDSALFTLSAWEELAEQCGRLLHRGDRVYVEGSLQLWPDWRSGHLSTSHSIVLDRIVLLAVGVSDTRTQHL
jgi:single-stranded DNA-binding protein